jgi:hypothetical protein
MLLYSLSVLGVAALAGSRASDPAKAATPNCQPNAGRLNHVLRKRKRSCAQVASVVR